MKVFAMNTLGSGVDIIDIVARSVKIDGLIGLSQHHDRKNVANFVHQQPIADRLGIPYWEVDTYNLSSDKDRSTLRSLEIDVLLVVGWQRLIPKWLINHCARFAVGIHGSPFGITKGRGRSPQNWALILGLNNFELCLFQIDAHIDSGTVFATRSFTLNHLDDITTSYYKSSILASHMIIDLLSGNITPDSMAPQNESEAEYFPQRLPEDGWIDWNAPTEQVLNFVRALTKPYPGARTRIGDNSIRIWRATPFDMEFNLTTFSAGEIVKVFSLGDFLVRTRDGFVLAREYDSESMEFQPKEGMRFDSSSFKEQLRVILRRHEAKYPMLTVAQCLRTAAEE
jgi:methionyl-tRNA formyltransferase